MALDIGELVEDVSHALEGTKDVVSDAASEVGEILSDAGDMAQEVLENMKEGVAEALERGDVKEAIERSDMPAETKEAMQETSKAFSLDISRDGKDIAKLGIGLLKAVAGFGTGNVLIGVLGGSQAIKAGVNLWQSTSQVSGNFGNAQMQKMALMK